MRPSVELVLRPWIDSRPAGPENDGDDAIVMFLDEILIDGQQLLPTHDWSKATLHAEAGAFLQVRIENPPAALTARYADPADHLLGTGDGVLLLPVGAITTRAVRAKAAA